MAKKKNGQNGSLDLHAEFKALAADFCQMEEEQADINRDFDKRQKRFEVALNKLAFLVGDVSKEGLKLYAMHEQTDRRLEKLEKEVTDLAVMVKTTGKQVIETPKRFDTWLKLEQKRRSNGHNGSNGKRN